MKNLDKVLAVVCILAAPPGFAHTELSSSTPADQAVLEAGPEELVLRFSEPVRLTGLKLETEGAEAADLGPLPSGMEETFTVALPPLEDGRYVVSWRALSPDTHVIRGELSFELSENATEELDARRRR